MMIEPAAQRVTVMGLGRFGGGVGVTRWLARHGAQVLVTDLQNEQQLAQPLRELDELISRGCVRCRLGEHHERDFTDTDLVIANPAVPRPWANPYLMAARDAGVAVTTEIRLLVEQLNRQRTIGVTGSAGKSTTAAMIHHILTASGQRSHLGGNIGGSLLDVLDSATTEDWFVLELSSFMLYWLGAGAGARDAAGWSPHIAVTTNIEPNHLDWHGTFEHYQQCKQTIVRHQHPGDVAIGREDTVARDITLAIPGAHNQQNARMAVRAAQLAAGIDFAAAALADFPGLPHRLQLVAEQDGLQFFNDSKATTPGATVLAVESFVDASKVHLIAGGYDKGSDLSPIAALMPRLAGMYTIGATGERLAEQAGPDAAHCRTLERAVATAHGRMKRGDVLLLSPGCASWDQFDHFQQRGEVFIDAVKRLAQHSPA